MSESGVSAKRVGFGLAPNRRSPKRPSEPRPSGVHPEEGAVERKTRSYLGIRLGYAQSENREALGGPEGSSRRMSGCGVRLKSIRNFQSCR